jgi:TolB protein
MFYVQGTYISGFSRTNAAFLRKASLFQFEILLFLLLVFASGCNRRNTADPILYLGWDDNETEQLYRQDYGDEPQQLTGFSSGVRDYAPSPDGRLIVTSTITENGDSLLWLMRGDGSSQKELYICSRAECANFDWAQDSRRLLFEKRSIEDDGRVGTPTLWWLDTKSGDVRPLHADASSLGAGGRLSPDGRWVSYHSPQQESLSLYNLEDSRSQTILNEIGTTAAWSPDSRYLVAPMFDLVILHGDEGEDHESHTHDYQTAVHLKLIDPQSGEQTNLSGQISVEDSVPAWSPDGQWIAFGRRQPGTNTARQIWVMRSDGSEARALTADPAINHGPPAWSADGRYLLFQQIDQNDLTADPQIWRIDVDSGEKELLAASGMQPSWLESER